VLLSPRDALTPQDFAEVLRSPRGPAAGAAGVTLEEAERRNVELVLQQEGWAVQRAADVLGISRTALYERMRKFGIKRPDSATGAAD
jgi:transcriptional regulator of acetoin/glycerol metabolism